MYNTTYNLKSDSAVSFQRFSAQISQIQKIDINHKHEIRNNRKQTEMKTNKKSPVVFVMLCTL
jgi:hypothetical protein